MEEVVIKENEIFIGQKPFMRYIRSAEILFRNKNLKTIVIRGRGMNVGETVDVSEAVKNKFCADLKLSSSVSISTENYKKEDREFYVSVIEIELKKGKLN
jgi:DNA-binding protein Alba